jgi:hypothetical protein
MYIWQGCHQKILKSRHLNQQKKFNYKFRKAPNSNRAPIVTGSYWVIEK